MSYENLPPRVAKLVMREVRSLVKAPPDGITYVPGEDECLNEIYAEIDGPGKFFVLLLYLFLLSSPYFQFSCVHLLFSMF